MNPSQSTVSDKGSILAATAEQVAETIEWLTEDWDGPLAIAVAPSSDLIPLFDQLLPKLVALGPKTAKRIRFFPIVADGPDSRLFMQVALADEFKSGAFEDSQIVWPSEISDTAALDLRRQLDECGGIFSAALLAGDGVDYGRQWVPWVEATFSESCFVVESSIGTCRILASPKLIGSSYQLNIIAFGSSDRPLLKILADSKAKLARQMLCSSKISIDCPPCDAQLAQKVVETFDRIHKQTDE